MSMLVRNTSNAPANSAEYGGFATDEIPHTLEVELMRLTLPSDTRTPRGAPASPKEESTINRLRRWASRPYAVLYRAFRYRKRRGELNVTTPLYLMAAAIDADSRDDIDTLFDLDERAECETRIAARRYTKYRLPSDGSLVAELEAVEQSISARIIACAARMSS